MNQEIRNIFFEALEYPEYARPFFYLKKQQESGWHKAVFLQALLEEYWRYETIFNIKLGGAKIKSRNIQKDEIQINIEKETNGKVKGEFTDKKNKELKVAIVSVYEIDRPVKKFNSYEVISFAEYSLKFIKNEFEIILKLNSPDYRKNLRTSYLISADAPFFDFYRFKNESRKLLYESRNLNQLKNQYKKIHTICFDIINLWNTKLYPAQQQAENDEELLPNFIRLTFESDSMKRFERLNDFETFDIKQPERYLLYDLAHFAARIGDFVSEEILAIKKQLPHVRQKPFIKDFLDGIHKLQKSRDKKDFIENVKSGKSKKEAPFCNWFDDFFYGRKYNTEVEPPKEGGRIDLRISHSSISDRIIEFKGWWNFDKKEIVKQVHEYLTEFEDEGFIFLINDQRKSITTEYQKLIEDIETSYEVNSWQEVCNSPTSYSYFKSVHQFGEKRKTLFHFIYSVWPNGEMNRIPKRTRVRRNKS